MRMAQTVKTAEPRGTRPNRARGGFTLVELLATMAILLLVGSIAATGIPVAQKAYTVAVDMSNAQILLSTCATSLRDELSVADPSTVVVGSPAADADEQSYVRFTSLETGYDTQVKYDANRGLYVQEAPAGETAGTLVSTTPLVPGKAAVGAQGALDAKIAQIAFDSASGVFTVKGLEVTRKDGSAIGDAAIAELKVKTIADPEGAA